MGVRFGTAGTAVVVVSSMLLAARAGASVVTEPIARLSVEGGYDSNVRLDGRGGDSMGRFSPEVGFWVGDEVGSFQLTYGGDFYAYQNLAPGGVWNHRGELRYDGKPDRRLTLHVDGSLEYALDPVGLARLGVVRSISSPAMIGRARVRSTWLTSRRSALSFTYAERDVRIGDGTGAALHTPGVEASWDVAQRHQVAVAYRFDVFEVMDFEDSGSAMAHELKAVYRYTLTRTLELEAEAGPALWLGQQSTVVPEAAVGLEMENRLGEARISLRHGVALAPLVNAAALVDPVVLDGFEFDATAKPPGTRWRLRAGGGLWRDTGADSAVEALSYSLEGEIGYRFTRTLEVGFGVSRFARLDNLEPFLRRTTLGLRVTWQLARNH